MSGQEVMPMASLALNNNPRGAGLFAVCIVLMVIATVAVGLRLWARKYKGTDFAADDYVTVFALIALFGNGLAECVAVILGGRGLHQSELSLAQIEINFKTLFAAQISWTLSTSAIKISLLLLYGRVFPTKNFKVVTFVMIGVVIAYCVGCLIAFLANCQPFQANFTPWMAGAHCSNPQAGWLGTGLANIITDIAILSLPMRNVWNLQLPKRTKLAVMGIFAIGFATVVISIIRLVSLFQINIMDFTYSAIPADILSAFEPTLAISCTCIPIMRPLFKRFFPSNHSRLNQYGYHYGHGTGRNANPEQRSDIAMSGLKKGSNNKHKRISIPATDGFRRLDDEDRTTRTGEWRTHFTSRAGTPTPSVLAGKQQGIEIVTDIVVHRD